jgi:hypothetical protein
VVDESAAGAVYLVTAGIALVIVITAGVVLTVKRWDLLDWIRTELTNRVALLRSLPSGALFLRAVSGGVIGRDVVRLAWLLLGDALSFGWASPTDAAGLASLLVLVAVPFAKLLGVVLAALTALAAG